MSDINKEDNNEALTVVQDIATNPFQLQLHQQAQTQQGYDMTIDITTNKHGILLPQ